MSTVSFRLDDLWHWIGCALGHTLDVMTLDPQCVQLDVGLRRRGVLVLATFGVAWAMAGSTGPEDPSVGRVLFAFVALLIGVVAARAVRMSWLPEAGRTRRLVDEWPRRFLRIAAAELVGIAVAVGACASIGATSAIPSAVCLVVGAHFLPLAKIFDQPQYRYTGALLLLVAAAGLTMSAAGFVSPAITTVGFGAAIILGGTALDVLVRG